MTIQSCPSTVAGRPTGARITVGARRQADTGATASSTATKPGTGSATRSPYSGPGDHEIPLPE